MLSGRDAFVGSPEGRAGAGVLARGGRKARAGMGSVGLGVSGGGAERSDAGGGEPDARDQVRSNSSRASSLAAGYGGQKPSSALRNPRGAPHHSLQTARRNPPPGDRCRDRNL